MKILTILAPFALMIACQPAAKETVDVTPAEERSIGFSAAFEDRPGWYLGTQEAIDIVVEFDKLWSAKNWDGMKPYLSDTGSFNFADGRTANSPDDFLNTLKADDEGSEDTWTFDGAFSVDLNPETGGEHVQARFTGTSISEGEEKKTSYLESYYIIQGKIVWWHQYTRKIPMSESQD